MGIFNSKLINTAPGLNSVHEIHPFSIETPADEGEWKEVIRAKFKSDLGFRQHCWVLMNRDDEERVYCGPYASQAQEFIAAVKKKLEQKR